MIGDRVVLAFQNKLMNNNLKNIDLLLFSKYLIDFMKGLPPVAIENIDKEFFEIVFDALNILKKYIKESVADDKI